MSNPASFITLRSGCRQVLKDQLAPVFLHQSKPPHHQPDTGRIHKGDQRKVKDQGLCTGLDDAFINLFPHLRCAVMVDFPRQARLHRFLPDLDLHSHCLTPPLSRLVRLLGTALSYLLSTKKFAASCRRFYKFVRQILHQIRPHRTPLL